MKFSKVALAANSSFKKESVMKRLTCDDFSDGFPTKHRVRFRARRTLVEGGYKLGADASVAVYNGVLFESNHSGTHLCVRVEHEDHWGRSRAWHGYVHRDNVLEIVLMCDGAPVAVESIEKVADQRFSSVWGGYHNTTEQHVGELLE